MKSLVLSLRGVAPLVLILVLVCAAAPAQTTVTLSPSHDAYVNDSAPNSNFNTAYLVVGRSTGEFLPAYRSLLRFNLAGIPTTATVTSSSLRLNLQSVEGTGALTVEARRALATWSGTTVTWNNQPGSSSPVTTTSVGTSIGAFYSFAVGGTVQGWVDGTNTNNGFVLTASGEATQTRTRTFASSNNTNAGVRPELMVTYTTPPDISVTPPSLAFGSVAVGKTSTAQTVTILNSSGSNLVIAAISSPDTEFVVLNGPTLPAVVPAGGNATFQARFAPDGIGSRSASISVASNDPDEAAVLIPCTGTGLAPDIAVTPGSFAFGNQAVNTTSTAQTLRIKNEGNAALRLSQVASSSAQFTVSGGPPLPANLAPGAEAAFDVRFAPASAGLQTASISVSSDDADEPTVTVPCTGTGTAAPEIQVTPASLAFADQAAGTTSTAQPLRVKNEGNAALRLSQVASSSAQFTVSDGPPLPANLAPGAEAAFDVRFAPTSTGPQAGSISVSSDDADEPVVNVALAGEGVPSQPPLGQGNFQRGDANDSGRIDLSDAVAVLGCLFLGSVCPGCNDAADSNDDGVVNIADPISLLGALFLGTRPPPAPVECGPDPTRDSLDCEAFQHCPQGPGIIRSVVLDKSEVCPGESLLVTVVTEHPDGEGKPVEVSINGTMGSEQHLQFRGVPGPRRILVVATTAEGQIDTREATVQVRKCDPASWVPDVRVAPNPFRPGSVDFAVMNVAELAMGAERYIWDYGDGEVEENSVPYASHRFRHPILLRDEPYTVFEALITVKPRGGAEVSAPKTVTVYNTYALDKEDGRIRLPAEWNERLETIGPYLVGRFTLTNLEDESIVFAARRVDQQPCDPGLDPRLQAPPEEISLHLGPGERFEASFVIPAASVPQDVCSIAVHLDGSTRSGTPASTSLYFEARQDPFLIEPERDYDVLIALNAVTASGLVPDTNRVNDEQLYRLAHEARIEFPVRGRLPLGGGGNHLPDPEEGEECTPGQPLRDGLTCAATAEWKVIHGFISNARKGELVLSPACGIIGAMLKNLPDAQLFSHVGIMTAHSVEIAHSTASEKRMKAHKLEIEVPGNRIPVGGIEPTALQFVWPGALVQSVEDAFRGKKLSDPEGEKYTVGSFAWGPVGCDGDEVLISPRIVKPSRDMEGSVTPTLHNAAEEARRIARDEGTHYRFFAYTQADLTEEAGCADPPPHAYCQVLCDRCIATMCSSFVWRSFKNLGVDLVEPEDPLDPGDGLFSYDEESRRVAAEFLYSKIHNDVQEKADDFEDILVDWLEVAERTANQIVNCFASGDCDEFESTGWRNPGTGLTASPDDTQDWDRVYGEIQDMVFRPAQWVRVHKVAAIPGTGDISGQVVDPEGSPVEGAEVTVDVHGVAAVLTGADGQFEFDAIPAGLRQVRATKLIGGLQHESCTVGDDFEAPADDCGLADVRARETVSLDLVLGPPPASLRCVAIRIDGRLTDYDPESANEHANHDDFDTVHLAPMVHIHEDPPERHDHGQGTIKFTSSCVDDELYMKLDFDVSLLDEGAVHVDLRARMYEGASCSTDDKDTDKTFDLGVIDAGATVTPDALRIDNEGDGWDTARYTITITNLQSDECSSAE